MQVAGGILDEAGGGGVINLFNSYPGDRKNILRDGGRGARGVIKIWGLKLKCT